MDHLAAPAAPEHDTFEGWTLASALAVRTTTIRIGHLVTCDPFRHPAVLAKMAATVDVLSEGRLELGLGWGSVRARARDVRHRRRPAQAARGAACARRIEVLDLMFAGEPFDHDGDLHAARRDRSPATGAAAAAAAAHRRRGTEAHDADGARPRGLVELPDLRGRPARRAAARSPATRASRCSTRSAWPKDADDAARRSRSRERRFGGWGGLIAGTVDRGRRRARGRGRARASRASSSSSPTSARPRRSPSSWTRSPRPFAAPDRLAAAKPPPAALTRSGDRPAETFRWQGSRGRRRGHRSSAGSAQRLVTTLPRV